MKPGLKIPWDTRASRDETWFEDSLGHEGPIEKEPGLKIPWDTRVP